jgi:hypothetical protein
MTVHRFAVNIPNPLDKPLLATLRLERVRHGGFKVPIDVPDEPLDVVRTGLTLDPCKRSTVRELVVELQPLQSVDVHVIAEVGNSGRGGSAAFHLSDERDGRVVGGVTVVCVNRAGPEHPGSVVSSPDPCPVTLAGDAYAVQVGGDPAQAVARSITVGTTMELVVPVVNPTAAALPNAQVYLEHLGISDATFRPTTWNLGDFRPGDTFFAAWEVSAHDVAPGVFRASVVALSEKRDPVRLQVPFRLQRADHRG